MSHRTHHGRLIALHTERVFPEPAFWACYSLFALLVLIALAGCAPPFHPASLPMLEAPAP